MRTPITISLLLFTVISFGQVAGSLDPTFGNGGKVVTSITNGPDKACDLVLQDDGKIVVAGYSSSAVTGKDFTCVRYNSDGSLDNSFGNAGIAKTDLQVGSDDVAYGLALQTDGKIVLAGYSDDGSDKNAALVRYNTDGSIDTSFGNNGIVLTDFDSNQQDEIRVVKIHPLTGNIVVGGSSAISSSVSKPVVARYTSDGTIDSSFNNTGIRLLWITSLDYQYLFSVEDLTVQANGKISAVGWRDFPGFQWSSDYWAGRINNDGSMDNTFSSDGVDVYNGPFNGSDRAYAMILNADNSMTVAGGGYLSTLYYDFSLFLLNIDGTVGNWSSSADYGTFNDDIVYGLVLDNNGKYVAGGSSNSGSASTFALARINSNGSLDNTFSTDGMVTTTFGNNAMNECYNIVVQTDNKIVAAGYTGSDFAIARYLGDDMPELDSFNLILPANLATSQNYSNLVFDWSNAFGATSYEIEVDTVSTFTGAPQTYTVTTSTKTVNNLLVNTKYFWRVRASDGNNWGQYSTVWNFTTNSLENFSLVLPADNSTNQQYASLMFDWTDALGASGYEMEIDSSQTFAANPQTYSVTGSTKTLANLELLTDYYWHVRATVGVSMGQWSATWKFTTGNFNAIDELTLSGLKIYPNPATDVIQVETSKSLVGAHYVVYDNLGKQMLNGILTNTASSISLTTLSAGTYFLQIEELQPHAFKVVKE